MQKNVAGQKIGAQLITAADGTVFTGAVTISVTGDAGTQATGSVGAGACAHEGNGYHTYAPAQAETNYDLIAFTFTGTGAIPATVQIFTRWNVNITHLLGTAWLTPGTAGTPDVNVKLWNALTTVALPLVPTVAGRTLDIAVGGEAGIDWANINQPSTTQVLNGTTIKTAADVETKVDTINNFVDTEITDIQTRLPASLGTNGSMKSDLIDVNGVASTSTGGRQEVNSTHWGGTAVASALVRGNLIQVGGSATPVTNITRVYNTDFAINYENGSGWDINVVNGDINGGILLLDILTYFNINQGFVTNSFSTAAKTELQTEANDALIANRLDELLAADSDIDGAQPPTVGSVFHELMTKTAGSFTYDQTTDSLEALRDRIDSTASTTQTLVVACNDDVDVTNARIGAFPGTSDNTLYGWLRALMAATSTPNDIGFGFSSTLHSLEAAANQRTAIATQVDTVDNLLDTELPALTAAVAALFTTARPQSYRTDGATGTIDQLLYELIGHHGESAIVATTKTVYQIDGTTPAMTFTLNSPTTPTAVTRAT